VADGSGGHAFAETYEQHQRNVTRWRQVEKSRAATETGNVDRVVPEGDGQVPPGAGGVTPELRGASETAPLPGARQGRARGFDASEGTSRDPLKNKTFDLSNPKNVPTLRQP
jgi:UPF0755 protein